jgi:type IV pilus assembly protein PilF
MNAIRCTLFALACCFLGACVTTTAPAPPRAASDSEAAQANLDLGVAYVQQGRPDLAIVPLQRALELNPRLADAHSTLAIVYDQLGDVEQAETHYRRSTEIAATNASAANNYAVFLCRLGRWQDAEPYFERVVQNPTYRTPDVALTNAGLCAKNAGDAVKAEQNFRAALARNTTSPGALSGLMELAYESGNYLRARAFMQRYLESQPANPAVLWMCYHIETQLDDETAAGQCAMRLTQEFPGSPEFAQLQLLDSDARQQ